MPEILKVEQYPNIVWSRITESDAEGNSYGLIYLRSPKQDLRLTYDGTLQPPPSWAYTGKHSVVAFGREMHTSTLARSNRLITLDDAEWINQVGQEVRTFTQRYQQSITAKKVILELEHLRMMLRPLITEFDPGLARDAGIIEELVKRQKEKVLPERIASAAERLKALEVTEFGEGPFESLWTPDWVLENLDRFSQVA